jgi:hypothetical protein
MRQVVVTRIIFGIHLLGIALLIFNLWRANYQHTSIIIPHSLKATVEKPIIISLIVSSTTLIISVGRLS